ncbi:hypothetical protein LO772_22350 [Yinghuangia sp. ASG 101]|uniref:hypothetical protein n=1 Tax=Yinghuangia sp. ASG 101 TaxID=2896848 RepID=UPI001E30CE99|nr:hypothetical protein [Yinghuangia sp. ASG 101]UGQ09648.1 hypothetical protein LO772_22350 [Yinghuangia sp. ASG 101]
MAGIEEGQWMRDRFEQGMRGGPPDTPAPHAAIERGGRARRRRRAAVAGSVAAVLLAAAAVTGVTLLGGRDGRSAAAEAPTTPSATGGASPAPTPTTAAAPPQMSPDGTLVVAEGQLQGTSWQIVRALGDVHPPGHPSETDTARPDSAVSPGTAAAPATGPPYCENVALVIDGRWAATFMSPCDMTLPWSEDNGRGAPVLRPTRASGGGLSFVVLQATPEVAKARIAFPDGTTLDEDAVAVPNTREHFVVFPLGATADADARGATYTFTAYDADGTQVDQDTFPNRNG